MTLKSLIISLFASFSKPIREEEEDTSEHEWQASGGWMIQTSDRKHIKRKAYNEWSKAHNIAERRKAEAEMAPVALAAGKKLAAQLKEQFDLPYDEVIISDRLPKHMQGQSQSTVVAMLRHENWKFDRESMKWVRKN